MGKSPIIFISHASADVQYVQELVSLLNCFSLTDEHIFCTSVPGYHVPVGNNIIDCMHSKLTRYNPFIIIVHSENYYKSAYCLNEMGASWVLRKEHVSILLPGFKLEDMTGVVNQQEKVIRFDVEQSMLRSSLDDMMEKIEKFFSISIKHTIWENKRDEFISAIAQIEKEKSASSANDVSVVQNTSVSPSADISAAINILQSKGYKILPPKDASRIISFGKYPQSIASVNPDKLIKIDEDSISKDDHFPFPFSPNSNVYSDGKNSYLCLSSTTPVDTENAPDARYSDGSEIVPRENQFFKYEPISWNVLFSDSEKSLLISSKILDCKLFTDKKYITKHGGRYITNFPKHVGEQANSWFGSTLRNWLNGEFLSTSFSQREQAFIIPQNLDKVFVLSAQDASNEQYGFSSDPDEQDTKRLATVTDYAIATGVRLSYYPNSSESEKIPVGWWWLSTPGDPEKYFLGKEFDSLSPDEKIEAYVYSVTRACDVMHDGHICTRGSIVDGITKSMHADAACDGTENGVRVALWIDNKFFDEK